MVSECIFCKVVKGEIKSGGFVYENDNFLAVFDVAPQVKHHVVIMSKKHFKTILDLPSSLGDELMACVKTVSLKLMKEFNYDGFNVVINTLKPAGQIIDHFHLNLLPRKTGDGYSLTLKKRD